MPKEETTTVPTVIITPESINFKGGNTMDYTALVAMAVTQLFLNMKERADGDEVLNKTIDALFKSTIETIQENYAKN